MTVADLIAFLHTQPQDIQVVYRCYSEQTLLAETEIAVQELCVPRPDGWVQNSRPDKEKQTYLVFPGN